MLRVIASQFGNPTGMIGHLVGRVMAYENRERNTWAVSLLDVQPTDAVLEVGFGPGLALQQIAEMATDGFVAGVDRSPVMVRQASTRNRAAITLGRVEVRQGTAEQLPYPHATFDKAITINSLHHWPDRRAGLCELQRVLKPAGAMIVVEQPRRATTKAMLAELTSQLMAQLVESGFGDVRYVIRTMQPAPTVAAIGRA